MFGDGDGAEVAHGPVPPDPVEGGEPDGRTGHPEAHGRRLADQAEHIAFVLGDWPGRQSVPIPRDRSATRTSAASGPSPPFRAQFEPV